MNGFFGCLTSNRGTQMKKILRQGFSLSEIAEIESEKMKIPQESLDSSRNLAGGNGERLHDCLVSLCSPFTARRPHNETNTAWLRSPFRGTEPH